MADAEKPNRLGGISDAFSDRNFRIYSAGSIGSWISFSVQLIAVSWVTWELTSSTRWLAIMALLDLIPNIVLMPLTGAVADRYDRHKIMIATSALLFVQAMVLAVLAWLDVLTVFNLAALVLIHGVVISFMVPAMFGTIPRFIAHAKLASALAVSSSYAQLALIAGPALAGWIMVHYGATGAFVVNAAGYAAIITAFACLKTPENYRMPEQSSLSMMQDIRVGLKYILARRAISFLLLILLVGNALSIGFFQMLPAYADTILGMGIVGLSTVLTCRGVGATAAALWLAHGGQQAATIPRVLWSFLIALLALAALVLTTNVYVAAGLAAIMGFATETRRTITMTVVQLAIDEEQRGRVMGTMFMLAQLGTALGAFLIGSFAVDVGLQMPTLIGVVIGLLIWLIIYIRQGAFLSSSGT